MPVLTRDALEDSPLADLHLIAAEIGLDGFRRLRKADLVDAILERQGGEETEAPAASAPSADGDEDKPARRPRRRRGARAARDAEEEEQAAEADAEVAAATDGGPADEGRAGGRGQGRDDVVEGTVELLDNGSAFLRLSPPEPSDADVYVSAAQVRRCELVSGDTVSGPVRPPRRSERFPSLARIDLINGRPADEVAEGTPFDELPARHPSERLSFDSQDPTLQAIEWLTPIGRGSRVVVSGAARAGKTEALRAIAASLSGQEGLEVALVLVGVRPEELTVADGQPEPAARLAFTASADAQAQAVERAVDSAKRIAARGGHAVLLIDSLDGLPPAAARRALGAARAILDGGSLTVVATATAPLGGETTVIALDVELTATDRLPALDLARSGTIRPQALVGDEGAAAIAAARAKALGV